MAHQHLGGRGSGSTAAPMEVINLITPPESPVPPGSPAHTPPAAAPAPSPSPVPPPLHLPGLLPIHLPPSSADAEERQIDAPAVSPSHHSSHSSEEDPSYEPFSGGGRRLGGGGRRQSTAGTVPECCFCPGFSRTGGVLASDMLGPFSTKGTVGKGAVHFFAHEVCALWAPDVQRDPETKAMVGVLKAHGRGRRLHCSKCRRLGATVGCYVPSCRKVFHYLCIMAAGCHLVKHHHAIFCPRHKTEAANPIYRSEMQAAEAANAAAVARAEAVAVASAGNPEAGMDAPHFPYTGLRRGESEAIVSLSQGVASSPPDGKTATVAMRTGLVLGPGERLILGDRPMRVPAAVLGGVLARLKAACRPPTNNDNSASAEPPSALKV